MGHADTDFQLGDADLGVLPAEVLALQPRMREIAKIVYLTGGATARSVEKSITDSDSNGGVRTMLNRLARRGILARRRSGVHTEIVYLPAILTDQVRKHALRRFVERNYDGSLLAALQSTLRLMGPEHRPQPRS